MGNGDLRSFYGSQNAPATSSSSSKAGLMPGDDVIVTDDSGTRRYGKTISVRDDGSTLAVWGTPLPKVQEPFCAGHFGVCFVVDASAVETVGAVKPADEACAIGNTTVAWLGKGHIQGAVTASFGE